MYSPRTWRARDSLTAPTAQDADRKVISVPGEFFDVDPGKRRGGRASRFRCHLRFSFGPPMSHIELALKRFRDLITTAP